MKQAGLSLLAAGLLVLGGVRGAAPGAEGPVASSTYLPEPASDLRFSHRVHLALDLECATCHEGVDESTDPRQIVLPREETCLTCHDGSTAPKECTTCHADAKAAHPVPRPVLHTEFSHRRHLERGAECTACHRGLEEAELATAANLPAHPQCWACHDGRTADRTCTVCHPSGAPRPADHTPIFLHSHQYAAKGVRQECETCHAGSESCARCHVGENVLPQVHDRNFIYSHPVDVRKQVAECQSCHEVESFCSDCHHEQGVIPPEHFLPTWAGPPFVHGQRARRETEACASCHQEEDPVCVRCHLDPDGVRGTNPRIHPSSITDYSRGPWHEDRGYMCYRCHVNVVFRAGQGFCGYCHGEKGEGDGED